MSTENFKYMSAVVVPVFLACTALLSVDVFVDDNFLFRNYTFVILTLLLFVWQMFCVKDFKIGISTISAAFTMLLLYIVLRIADGSGARIAYLLSSIVLLQCLYNIRCKDRIVAVTFVVLCSIQIVVCVLQWLNFLESGETGLLAGTFDNPTGVSLLLTSGIPFMYSLYCKKPSVCLLAFIVLVWLTVAFVGSRAGILSLFVVSLLYAFEKYKERLPRFKLMVMVSVVTLFMLTAALLLLKSGSTIGRFLISKLTWSIAFEKMCMGSGVYGFTSRYMDVQADYFNNNPDSIFSQVADIPMHPLNEYLMLFVQYGIVGAVLLVVLILGIRAAGLKKQDACYYCLVVLAIQSCFTYSMRYSFVWFVCILCLSQVMRNTVRIQQLKSSFLVRLLSVVACVGISYLIYKDISFEHKWGKLVDKATTDELADEDMQEYKKLETDWNGNPFFYYNYAAALRRNGYWEESNEQLVKYGIYVKDYYGLLMHADNYYSMECYNLAAKYYERTHNMCPSRFVPLQGMMRSYQESGDMRLAYNTARKIIGKKVKVKSYNVSLIKKEAEKYITEYEEITE